MKLIKISSKNLSPKCLFGSKDRSSVSRCPSFGSGSDLSSSFSSSPDSIHKPGAGAGGITTPTSVLPQKSGVWSHLSADLDVAQAFKLIDRDNDGVVSRKELEAFLYQLGNDPPSQEEVTLMLSEVDRDGNGMIILEALLNQVGPVFGLDADSELRDAFEVFDTDNDGKISAEELLSFSADLDVAQAFKLIDRDNDGVVSRKELEAFLYQLGNDPPSQEEVTLMLSEVDRDGNGMIILEALLNQVVPVFGLDADSELRDAFEVFDTDNDGKISAEELLRFFTSVGDEGCTLEECRRMIDGVDKDGDGFVCFEEFVHMMEPQR